MNRVVRVSVVASVMTLLAISMSGCPGGQPSIVGLWSISIDGNTFGVQFNENGTVEPVDIGTGSELIFLTTWATFKSVGFEFRQANTNLIAMWIGTTNADGTMSGFRFTASGPGDLNALNWVATKL